MNGQFGVSALLHAAVVAKREQETARNHVILSKMRIVLKLKSVVKTNAHQVKSSDRFMNCYE